MSLALISGQGCHKSVKKVKANKMHHNHRCDEKPPRDPNIREHPTVVTSSANALGGFSIMPSWVSFSSEVFSFDEKPPTVVNIGFKTLTAFCHTTFLQ